MAPCSGSSRRRSTAKFVFLLDKFGGHRKDVPAVLVLWRYGVQCFPSGRPLLETTRQNIRMIPETWLATSSKVRRYICNSANEATVPQPHFQATQLAVYCCLVSTAGPLQTICNFSVCLIRIWFCLGQADNEEIDCLLDFWDV